MKKKGRPKKRPDAKKQKVTLTLDPPTYSEAQKLCFEEGISLSEKVDRLFRALINDQKKKGRAHMEKGHEIMKSGDSNSHNSHTPIVAHIETDAAGRLVKIDEAFTLLCGYEFKEIAGKKAGEFLVGPDTDTRESAKMREAIRAGTAITIPEIVNYYKDGEPYRVRIEITPSHDRRGRVIGFSAVETELV